MTSLLNSSNSQIRALEISALVRNKEQTKLLATKGVKPLLFTGLDDTDALRCAAAEHDIIINTASAFHSDAAAALIEGLALRMEQTRRKTHLIHVRRFASQ